MIHVVFKAKLEKDALENPEKANERAKSGFKFSKLSYQGFLSQLRNWTSGLQPKNNGKTFWGDYSVNNTYQNEEAKIKRQLIFAFAKWNHPKMLVDLGAIHVITTSQPPPIPQSSHYHE